MDPRDRFHTLLEAGVLAEGETGITLTAAFEEHLDSPVPAWERESADAAVEDELLATYEVALRDSLDGTALDPEPLVPLVLSLHRPPERTSGAPAGFLPIRGGDLGRLVAYVPAGVVYVWQVDCEPCETMAERLANLVNDRDDVAALAVYGPADMETLYEEFDVYGAPTTLFIADGRPDSRLIGSQRPSTIEAELEIITDRSV
jgi:thiol-disulfide isomerase/thioredoxin